MDNNIFTDRVTTNSADELESVITPVSGSIKITPKYKNNFKASLSLSRVRRIGIALIDIEPMHTLIDPQNNFYCLTVPIVNSCNIKDGNIRRDYSKSTAHLLYPERELDSYHNEQCKLLGVTYMLDNLDEIAEKTLGNTDALVPKKDSSLSLTTPAGILLVNYLSHICGDLTRDNIAPDSDLATTELEDDLITALLLAMDENHTATRTHQALQEPRHRIALAEEYLLNNLTKPVSRTKLAEVAGSSIRSLSRAFVKRHGVGPMRFLKERRLEAVRMELINSRPENTKVSDIALRYGFTELGKFSLLYKSVYKEKPSDTLKY